MPNQYRGIFPHADQVTYLDTAAEGLPFPAGNAALADYFADKSVGSPGRRQHHSEEERARCAVARLLGSHAENVALVSSASDALNLLANSIEWKSGDEVLTSDLEFPSGVVAWLRLRRLGVKVRVLPSRDGYISLQSFQDAIHEQLIAEQICPGRHEAFRAGQGGQLLNLDPGDLERAATRP